MLNQYGYFGRANPGLCVDTERVQSLHLRAEPPAPPKCEDHDSELVEIRDTDLPDAFDTHLRESKELFACPECFPSDEGDIDTAAVAKKIADDWQHYREYFTSRNRPEMENHGPTFGFR